MSHVKRILGALLLSFVWTSLFSIKAHTQGLYGNIAGAVTDTSGFGVPGASVTVTSVERGVAVSASTSESGNYSVTHLLVGTYAVTVEKSGFKKFTRENVAVSVDATTYVDASLQLGNLTQEVTVSGAPPLLKLDRADVSQTLTSQQIAQLPTLNRNVTSLELLVPGTAKSAFQHATSENPQGGLQINSNGLAFGQSYFLLDGVDNFDPVLGIAVINPNVSSLAEFKVMSGNYDAEFAQAGGTIVEASTKAGTNQIHGDAFDFLQNNVFEARDPFTQGLHAPGTPAPAHRGIPPLRFNQFGGSLGGPIKKDKVFVFGDYQGARRRIGGSVLTRVPTAAEESGDLSDFGIPIFDPGVTGTAPTSGRTQFADPTRATASNPVGLNIIPTSRISPQAANLLKLLPAPNLTAASPFLPNYDATGAESFDTDQFDVRVDHYYSDRLRYFGRYTLADFRRLDPAAFGLAGGPNFPVFGFAGHSTSRDHSLVLGLSDTVGSNVIADFRFSAYRYHVKNTPPDFGIPAAANAGIPGLNNPADFNTSGLPSIIVGAVTKSGFLEGFGQPLPNACNCPLIETSNLFDWVTNWTYIHGSHTFKWGADVQRAQNYRFSSDNHRSGVLNFNDSVTGDSSVTGSGLALASFLLGMPNTFARLAEIITNAQDRQTRMFYYGQDSWRIVPKLTLNFGLRWDTWFADTSLHPGQGSVFNNKTISDGLLRVPGVAGIPLSGGINTQYGNISPRFSFAYSLDPKTVVRAGWGRSYFEGFFGFTFNDVANGYPTVISQSLSAPSLFQPTFLLSAGPPAPTPTAIPSNGLLPLPNGIGGTYIPTNQKIPYVDQWNFAVEREVTPNTTVTASYVGNVGRHQPIKLNLNQAFPGPGPLNPRRPFFSAFGWTQGITELTDGVDTSYNALQAKAERRFSKNLSFLANFSWSRATDYGTVLGASASRGRTDNHDYRIDRGPADFDHPVVFTLGHTYVLPFGPGQRWLPGIHGALKQVAAGWQWSGITTAESGEPFSPLLSNTSSLNADPNNLRPNKVGNPFAGVTHDRNAWFNPSAYAVPAQFTYGNASRNSLRGPNLFTADWSLAKNFQISERFKLEFRWETFNVFNRTNLQLPGLGTNGFQKAFVDTPSGNKIFDVLTPMRNMQFALLLSW